MRTKNRLATNIPYLQGLRVLVVDNNVDCCDTIAFLLQLYGIEVKTAFLAQQALKIFGEWQPDILVSDIALPEIDGFALVRQARTIAAEREKELLIIAVTGYVSEKMRQLALSSGFDLWFTKPLNIDGFITVLVNWAIDQFSSTLTQRTFSKVANNSDLTFQEHRPNLNLSGVS